jgi:glycosyltransferase involved in cell wall biosynthesis
VTNPALVDTDVAGDDEPTEHEASLSFVVIAYNEAGRIESTIASIQSLDDLPDYEVIVVDDGSTDATVEVVEQIAAGDDRVSVVKLGVNRGRGAARAAGVNEACGRFIAMVDADILLPASWWTICREAIVDFDAVSGTAVPDGDVVYLSDRLNLEPKVAEHATAATGSNTLFKRAVFDQVNFDQARRNGEDVALAHAMHSCGFTTHAIPGLTVRHHEDKTFGQAISWLYESGIGASRQLERYRVIRRPDQAAAVIVCLAFNALRPRRGSRASSFGLFVAALLGVSALHVRTKFVLAKGSRIRFVIGVLTDALLIAAYTARRVAGHGYVCRRSTE